MKDKDNPVWFPGWMACLEGSGFPPGQISSMASVIRWYLSFCKRGRVRVTFASARDFLESGRREKNPSQELEERWKEAIRWFFRAAKSQNAEGGDQRSEVRGQRSKDGGHPPWPWGQGRDKGGEPEWLVKMGAVLRVRHYSYRTDRPSPAHHARTVLKVNVAGEGVRESDLLLSAFNSCRQTALVPSPTRHELGRAREGSLALFMFGISNTERPGRRAEVAFHVFAYDPRQAMDGA